MTFLGGGLPAGTPWSVTLGSISRTNSGPNVVFAQIPAGTYPFSVQVPGGYQCSPQSGSIVVASDTRTSVTFAATSTGDGFSAWPPAPAEVILLVGIAGVGGGAVVTSELVGRRRARRAEEPPSVPPSPREPR